MIAPCVRSMLSGILAETGEAAALRLASAEGVAPFPAGAAWGSPDMVRLLRGPWDQPAAVGAPAGLPGSHPWDPQSTPGIAPGPEPEYRLPGWAFGLSPRALTLWGEHR